MLSSEFGLEASLITQLRRFRSKRGELCMHGVCIWDFGFGVGSVELRDIGLSL